MNSKDRTKNIITGLFGLPKPLITGIAILVLLLAAGHRSATDESSLLALDKSGLSDAREASPADPEDFNYNFSVKDLNGNKFAFDQFRGKVVFLNLWATWCGPCRAEMEGIQRLYEKVNNDSIVFVMLSIDRDRDKGKIIEYLRQKEFNFPVYQPSGYLTDQLNVPLIPTTFVISKEGKIVKKEIGSKNYNNQKFQKYLITLSQ